MKMNETDSLEDGLNYREIRYTNLFRDGRRSASEGIAV